MFRKIHVFRRCVLNEFRSRFQWKIVCSGGTQELKTVEILLPNWYFLFSLFFQGFGIQINVRKQWKFKVYLTLPTVAKRWFSLPCDGRHMKIKVFQESLWSLPGKHFGGFRGRWKRKKGRPKRVQRCRVKCSSDAQNLGHGFSSNTILTVIGGDRCREILFSRANIFWFVDGQAVLIKSQCQGVVSVY